MLCMRLYSGVLCFRIQIYISNTWTLAIYLVLERTQHCPWPEDGWECKTRTLYFSWKKMKNYSCQKIISSSEYHIFIAVCAKMWWEGWEYFEKKKNNFSLKNSILSIVMAFSWIVPICYILRMWLSNWNTTLTSTQRGPCTCDLYWHHTDLPAEGWLRTRDLFMHNWKGWVLQHGQFLEPHVYAKRQCTSI